MLFLCSNMSSAKTWIVFVLTAVNVYVESSEDAQSIYGPNSYSQAYAGNYASSSAYSDAYNGNIEMDMRYLPHLPWIPLYYCRPDEEFNGCINAGCGRWECSQPESGICIDVVPGGCIPGCRCREPLLRTDDGRCVLASQCPPPKCRGPNEFFMCGPACDNVCSELNIRNQTHCDILNIQCNSMCYCIEGHARDANGICIPIEHCPVQFCGENEEYTPYGICQARTCDDLGYPLPCYDPNSGITFNQGPGCVCKPGYVRDCNGKCIPNSQCPSCGGDPNATSGCGTFCTTCDNYGQEVFCIQSCILNGCACRDGYIYDTVNKKCVLPQNCPAKICNKPNEILGCKNACPVRTCASTRFKQLYKCPPPPKNCEQACVCAPGFFRNGNGDCVTRDQCFPNITCGPDEEYNSCANGGCGRWLCSQPGSICINLVEGGCVPGCRCKAPLLRTSDGRCVPSNQCPQPQCGINEEYVQCKDSVCRPQACGDLGFPLGSQQAIANNNQGQTCQQGPGCVCKEGFVRDSNGNCISAEQCPSCGDDPNATTSCGTFCTTCDNYGQEAFCILSCQLNGCACRNGYIYDTVNKKCILPQNCPPKQCTKPNEISGCNNTCPPRTCEAKDKIYECPLLPLTPQPCVQTCICAPGFYRNAAGDCVTKDQCLPLNCRPDEELYGCINAPCGRWECSQPESGICIDVAPGACIPGCKCREPLLRTDDGRCVLASQCPPPKCRGPNEFFMCGPACDNVCSELNIRNQTHCDILNIQCNSMCYCIEGHARDANGICIPIEQCPEQFCGENEEYTPYGICQARTCDDLGYPLPCYDPNSGITFNQGPGCVCKPGYVRDCNGKCIPNSQCPSCGGDPNATSGCGTFCTTCDNYGQEVFCKRPCILNGCACRDGYIYDTVNKKCVLPQNCPAKICNKPNEILGCKNACPVRTCASTRFKQLYKCPPPPKNCEQACVCAPGFFKNGNGDCVTRDQCFPNITCGPDEEYNSCANGGCGRWLCSQPSSICINLVEGGCVPGCRCKAPLLRTSDGRCVPSNQCPQPQCGINEEYVQCKDSVCRPQACGDLGFPLGCQQAIANNNQDQTCQQGPGCVCKEGFVRDSNGNCISAEQCPSCGGDPNATTGCGTFCTTCDNYGQEAFCILSCQLNGCACRNGYIYDTVNKKCVLPQNCPPKQCTKPNEISGCNNTCPPRTCEAKDRKYECPLLPLTPQPCVQTCICAPGFYRNAAGDCVTKDQCPPNIICGPDEEYNGCSNGGCGRWLCSQPAALCIDLIEGGCIPGCRCKAPLLKTSDGRCVPSDQCPQPQCGLNEEYVQCIDSVCRPQKCEELGFPLPCQQAIADSNQACYQGPGCVCKEGFVRDGNGNCISAQQCPSCGGDPNATTGCGTFCTTCDNYGQEVFCILSCQLNGCACRDGYIYDTVNKKCVLPKNCPKKCNKPNEIIGCKNACPPRTCEAKDRVHKCPPRPQLCEPDCVCAPGFYRNAGGYCVTKEQCDQCSGPNEFFSCGGACDNVCSELSIRNQTKCDIINIKCNDKCYCLEGFARDANGICIPIKHCPNPVQCGVNAEFVTQPVCRPETCSDLGFPLPCLDPKSGITASHGPGCVCKVGFVRDSHGKCVSEKQCPSCGGDPNATTGCGTFCETCDNYGQNVPCILICRSNSCACKNGYIYDTLNKKCVLPQNCPAKCSKPNEEWGCQNACPPRVCESIGKDIKCPIVAQVCIPACNCKRGFFRNKAGDCVSKQQCLEPPKCGKNEVYAKAVSCPPQTCLSRLALYNCPPQNATSIAKYECRCKPGFLRNEIDECIPADKCSSCNGKNEIYARSVSCPPQTCASITARYDCSKFKPPAKEFECRCKPGFFRNKINECISTQECGKCTGPNEYYSCGPACDNVCSELSIRNQTNCDIINVKCNDKCYCIKGHARDANGICVPIKDCPPQCGLNEEYVQCTDSVCRPQKCEELGFPLPCQQAIADRNQASYQGPGCVCKEGFVRDGNGNCISAKQCPSCGGDPNATTGCGTFCTTCDNYGQEVFCILSCQLNGCACRDGYIYDTVNKKCVLPKNCPKKCNKPNEIIGCKNACPLRTCEAKDRVYKCPPRPQLCEPDCVCAPGFYRNAGGYCVTKEQCDQCSGPNEFFSCGGACDNVCSELSIRNQTKCDIINIKCNDKCYCLEGFARDANGICIPIKHCPNPVQCGVNAEFVTQPVCRPETCSDLGFPLPCLDPKSGITASHGPGCVCKVGFVRDNHGKCVSEKQCPSCGGDPNATTGCGTFCETCDNYGQNVACILICKPNGCACKNGYIYDTLNKKCVLPQNCPAKCNKPNEEWGCQNTCPPRVCESIGKDIKCPIVAQVCIPACNCKNGFFRNKAGDCVSKQQCLEPPKCGKNEVYAKAVSCPPQTCLSKLALYKCPPQNATSIAKYECRCKPGFLRNEIDECIPAEKCSSCNGKNEIYARSVSCPPQTCASITARYDCSKFKPPTKEFECRCKPGFFRNKINECISTQECGKCTGPNEYYSCGPACDNVCSELSIRNQTNCDIINVKCNDKCYCIKGHARDANGICVPIKDCPPQCGPNQEYVECPDAVCRPKTCDQVGFPVACPDLSSGLSCQSKPCCICSEGYVQHQNGTCIPYSACPSCGGDANAVSGCGVYCNTKCTGNTKICPKICNYNSCDCKPGFLLDTVLNACVLPDKCTCGPNEVFSKCTNRACHRSNCAQLSIPWVCRHTLATPSSPDNFCVPGCECVLGYLRNSNGVCIPQNQCPEAKNQTGSNTNNGDVNAAAQLENGNGVFTSRFLYVAAKNNPGQSVVASPLSVLFLLAQVALFATGVALEQLYALLNLNSPQQIRGTIPPYLISFNSEKNIILRLAERVYGSEKYPFSESFKEVTRNVFLAEAQNLDFSNPKYAAKTINDWIASQTNNLIQNLVPEDSLNADTRLVLTNAIYMRANFSKPFNTENTQPKDFHVSDTKTVTVRMMNQVSRFRYGVMPKSQAQVVEIPYQNENASLLILLPPKTADGMDNLLEEQLGFTSITSVLLNLSYKKVNLSIPSFGTETRTDLKDILEKAGVKQIFKPDSGLSGIFAKPENVSVSYASQLAKITVDEFGAEAAAGNAFVVGVTSVGVIEDPIDFYADRNFLYFLLLRGNPLFCGRYAGPQ